jgi:hypothetical protein
MGLLEGVGLRQAVRQYHHSKPEGLVRIPIVNDLKHLPCMVEMHEHLDRSGAVLNVMEAAGAKRLWIVPGAGVSGIMSEVADARLADGFPGGLMKAGDPVLFYDPQNYFVSGSAESRGDLVRHALWKLFMRQAFPAFTQDLARVGQAAKERFPEFPAYFLKSYFNFALRVAAMEAACFAFASADSAAELSFQERLITGNGEVMNGLLDYRTKAALFSGLLFAHVFAFELFPDSSVTAMFNLEKSKILMQGLLDREEIMALEGMSRALLKESLLPGQPSDIRMDGHYGRLMEYWGWALRNDAKS